MIGYGLLNSGVHEYCIRSIIKNFFYRSLFFLYPVYLKGTVVPLGTITELTDSEKNKLFEIFLKEEQAIDKKNNSDNNTVKYILSANVSINKDYEFAKKDINLILEEGKQNLNKIFLNELKKFTQTIRNSTIESEFLKSIDLAKKAYKTIIPEDVSSTAVARPGYGTISKLTTYLLDNQIYLNKIDQIISFYSKEDLLSDRVKIINILDQQINSLNPEAA